MPINYLSQLLRQLRESNRLLERPAQSIRAKQRQRSRSRAAIELLETRQMLVASLAINNASIVEGTSGSSNLNFTVTRSGDDTLSAITVAYNTSNSSPAAGAATAVSDYTAISGTVTIPSGSTTATISVPVTGDTTVESNEQFFVNLTEITNVTGPAATYAAKTDFTTGTKPWQMAIGDLNGDGKPELTITRLKS